MADYTGLWGKFPEAKRDKTAVDLNYMGMPPKVPEAEQRRNYQGPIGLLPESLQEPAYNFTADHIHPELAVRLNSRWPVFIKETGKDIFIPTLDHIDDNKKEFGDNLNKAIATGGIIDVAGNALLAGGPIPWAIGLIGRHKILKEMERAYENRKRTEKID